MEVDVKAPVGGEALQVELEVEEVVEELELVEGEEGVEEGEQVGRVWKDSITAWVVVAAAPVGWENWIKRI